MAFKKWISLGRDVLLEEQSGRVCRSLPPHRSGSECSRDTKGFFSNQQTPKTHVVFKCHSGVIAGRLFSEFGSGLYVYDKAFLIVTGKV